MFSTSVSDKINNIKKRSVDFKVCPLLDSYQEVTLKANLLSFSPMHQKVKIGEPSEIETAEKHRKSNEVS